MSPLVPEFQLFCNSIHALIKFVQAPLDNSDMPLMLSAMISNPPPKKFWNAF